MSDAQEERAIMRIYDDSALTEDLQDEDANVLLKWSEKAVGALARRDMDDETFDGQFKTLRRLIKRVNTFVGEFANMDEPERAERVAKIAESAREIGFNVTDAQLQTMLQENRIGNFLDMLTEGTGDQDGEEERQ